MSLAHNVPGRFDRRRTAIRTEVLILSLTTFVVLALFVLSLPHSGPYIRTMCVLSRYGITPVASDSMRIFCHEPTGRVTKNASEAGADNTRRPSLHDYDEFDFLVPYGSWIIPERKSNGGVNE